jgi:hypothetical protein
MPLLLSPLFSNPQRDFGQVPCRRGILDGRLSQRRVVAWHLNAPQGCLPPTSPLACIGGTQRRLGTERAGFRALDGPAR